MTLHEKLRMMREIRGETQETTSEGCGVTRQAYARYEIGLRYPSSRVIGSIARHFGVTVEQLTDDSISVEEILNGSETSKTSTDETPLSEEERLRQQVEAKLSRMSLEQLEKARSYIEFLAKGGA